MKKRLFWGLCLVVALVLVGGGLYIWHYGASGLKARAREVFDRKRRSAGVRVEVTHPARQSLDRTTVQPGTVQAYESADLYCEVSGYLKKLYVDLGSKVKEGDVLAEVDVPDLEAQQAKADTLIKQAEARVAVARAGLNRANAEFQAAQAAVPQAEATLEAASASRRARVKQYRRILDLYKQKGVELRLVDEAEEHRDAAVAREQAARLGVYTARAQEKAALAKVAEFKADLAEAIANVRVAEARRVGVQVKLATIRSPYTGVITRRNFFRGGFIRSAKEGERVPLLAIERTDKVRVVVQVPDREVQYADKGDEAIVEFDIRGGKTYKGTIARTQGAEDTLTRTMRVEIDLDNPRGELRPGMFARVSILLEKAGKGLSIPSSCLVGGVREGHSSVFVVRDGRAYLTPIQTGLDNGVRVEVLSGLTDRDVVVRRYSGTLTNGSAVRVSEAAPSRPANKGH